ncbi:MAG: HetP family heterocyst commitment protein [Cyanobacteriota bacterium]|nr:HetP family heterocyst commitment protein [Cyanobacteriota bacterium]
MKNANFRDGNRSANFRNRMIDREQYVQIVEAIEAGKYSWACFLILRFAGDNPLMYIPYRTANRLMKENQRAKKPTRENSPQFAPEE